MTWLLTCPLHSLRDVVNFVLSGSAEPLVMDYVGSPLFVTGFVVLVGTGGTVAW